jgi:hypothetical protein
MTDQTLNVATTTNSMFSDHDWSDLLDVMCAAKNADASAVDDRLSDQWADEEMTRGNVSAPASASSRPSVLLARRPSRLSRRPPAATTTAHAELRRSPHRRRHGSTGSDREGVPAGVRGASRATPGPR